MVTSFPPRKQTTTMLRLLILSLIMIFSLLLQNASAIQNSHDNKRFETKKNGHFSFFKSRNLTAFLPLSKPAMIRMNKQQGSDLEYITNSFCSSPPMGVNRLSPSLNKGKHEATTSFLLSASRRGGGGEDKHIQSNDEDNSRSKLKKNIGIVITLSSIVTLFLLNRDALATFNFKEELAKQLDELSSMGRRGLITYILGFMLWELVVGVTTPVETAAGMAFGFKNGVIVNAIGKTSGAIGAFLLGRFVLRDYVTKKLEDNEYMDLVKDSIIKRPIRVALIWRFSFLPEQIKNFGLAILPVKTWQFVSAVLLHGFPFTLLWTFMGNEIGMVVKGVLAQPSKILKILTAAVYVFGFFISPSMVGLWIKGLRDEKLKRLKKS